ncbi:DNA-processing protein DprA [Mediterraneibacter faecis]|uniref:DNA-processing protein DprA n=1 Tax=Mediterraneibacter faecis TaxID=592978 RepID=UPI002ED55F90
MSGMAKGIDACAATVSINEGGYTIAVLGNGLDICYPSEHQLLMDKIREKGLLISEYPPGTRPTRYNFPKRNRLISAWSDKVIIIAPGKRSGALITGDYAKKYGRETEISMKIRSMNSDRHSISMNRETLEQKIAKTGKSISRNREQHDRLTAELEELHKKKKRF